MDSLACEPVAQGCWLLRGFPFVDPSLPRPIQCTNASLTARDVTVHDHACVQTCSSVAGQATLSLSPASPPTVNPTAAPTTVSWHHCRGLTAAISALEDCGTSDCGRFALFLNTICFQQGWTPTGKPFRRLFAPQSAGRVCQNGRVLKIYTII